MNDYHDRLNGDTPLVDLSKEYVGKHVEWSGFIHSWDTYPDQPRLRYRITLVPDRTHFKEYVYCHLSAEGESCLKGIGKDAPVRIAGILSSRSDVKLTAIRLQD